MNAEPSYPHRARHALIGALMLALACHEPAINRDSFHARPDTVPSVCRALIHCPVYAPVEVR